MPATPPPLSRFFLNLALDVLLLLGPIIISVQLIGSGPASKDVDWWLFVISATVVAIAAIRLIFALIDGVQLSLAGHTIWLLGKLFRVGILACVIYAHFFVLAVMMTVGDSPR